MRPEELKRFLTVLNEVTTSSVEEHIGPADRARIHRYAALPARVVAYLSTAGAIGWEYKQADSLSVEVVETDRPPEDEILESAFPALRHYVGTAVLVEDEGVCEVDRCRFLFDRSEISSGSARGSTDIFPVAGSAPLRLRRLNLKGSYPFRVMERGFLRVIDSAIVFGTRDHTIRFAEFFGPERALEGITDADAVATANRDVMLAMTDIADARDQSLDVATFLRQAQGTVLVLGDFKEGIPRLEQIKSSLRNRGFRPHTLLDVPDDLGQDLSQKFQLLALASEFVLFEDSVPSGHLVEGILAEQARVITAVIHEEGRRSSYMTAGRELTSKVVREWEYTSATLDDVIGEACDWVQGLADDLRQARIDVYPWRITE